MPQDTTVYTITNPTDSSSLPDSIKAILNAMPDTAQTKITPRNLQHPNNEGTGNPIFVFVIILSIFLLPTLLRYFIARRTKKKKIKDYLTKEIVFDNILQQYNPYYKSLNLTDREYFMQRTVAFMGSKDFQYIGIEPEEMMPLLISGAAIQLTFRLKHYLLDYFKTIYVLRDNYTYGLYNHPFEGHVSEDGVYLSWSNFIREYNDYTDGQNVGLHELSHALTYVNFTVEDGADSSFHDKFKEFSKIARPLFEKMQAGQTNLLDRYAATNYHEFWAVCIENFFERPTQFKQQMPSLYFALCNLLNQDPMTPHKIISTI
ncbi:MAG: zinc-dependent peptidase [Bacteroidetes bacterium]|nr:zinc-dependent peptidase [Bacteroidota bacterium]